MTEDQKQKFLILMASEEQARQDYGRLGCSLGLIVEPMKLLSPPEHIEWLSKKAVQLGVSPGANIIIPRERTALERLMKSKPTKQDQPVEIIKIKELINGQKN